MCPSGVSGGARAGGWGDVDYERERGGGGGERDGTGAAGCGVCSGGDGVQCAAGAASGTRGGGLTPSPPKVSKVFKVGGLSLDLGSVLIWILGIGILLGAFQIFLRPNWSDRVVRVVVHRKAVAAMPQVSRNAVVVGNLTVGDMVVVVAGKILPVGVVELFHF